MLRRCHLVLITFVTRRGEDFYRGLQGYDVMQAGANVSEEHSPVPSEARCLILLFKFSEFFKTLLAFHAGANERWTL
jgi:hypothetical protein